MTLDLTSLEKPTRLLFSVSLKPLQGDRFQPTGFPSLGAATYETSGGTRLLVESAQSMANRMEATCWDASRNTPIAVLNGISHVTVNRGNEFLTDSMLEAHRLNSPYLLENRSDGSFKKLLVDSLGGLASGPINRRLLAETLLKYDVGSLLHGVFLAKPDLAGGRLRVARALSSFIEASGARVAASGGVKNDHVNPSGDTKSGFGNVPFARDEFTADVIHLHVNFDLAQVRGYGLGPDAEHLLILLGLHRVRKLLDGDLRLRTACDLEPIARDNIAAWRPAGFVLPTLAELEQALRAAIAKCEGKMIHTKVKFDDKLESAKERDAADRDQGEGDDNGED